MLLTVLYVLQYTIYYRRAFVVDSSNCTTTSFETHPISPGLQYHAVQCITAQPFTQSRWHAKLLDVNDNNKKRSRRIFMHPCMSPSIVTCQYPRPRTPKRDALGGTHWLNRASIFLEPIGALTDPCDTGSSWLYGRPSSSLT